MFEKSTNLGQEKPKEKFPNIDKEVSASLERIDFNELRDVFLEIIQSVGMDHDKNIGQFISDSSEFRKGNILTNKQFGAGFDLARQKIIINWPACKEAYVRLSFGGDADEDIKNQFILKLVCHEEAHAISHYEQCLSHTSLLSGSASVKSGYSVTEVSIVNLIKWKKEYMYSALNEAITELVASDIFFRYKKRKNEDLDERILFSEVYAGEIEIFNSLSDIISNECGIKPGVLWQVILRGYFAGEDLSGDRMKKLFKNVFPKNFEKELVAWRAGQNEEKQEYVSELIKQMKFTDDDKKRIRRWIMSVYQKMPASQKDKVSKK